MKQKQMQYLNKLGVSTIGMRLTNFEAGQLIEKTIRERNAKNEEMAKNARQADLYTLASAYVDWAVDLTSRAQGPCPICRAGTDRFYVNKSINAGGCNKCSWEKNGEGAGPVGFVCAVENVDWLSAMRIIDGDTSAPVRISQTHKKTRTQSEEWRAQWSSKLAQTQKRYENSAAQKYLRGRGISDEVADLYGVGGGAVMGDGPHRGQPVAIFPYYDADGKLCAINRRVACSVPKDKTRFVKGSIKKIGSFRVSGADEITWVVEGEINAMSVTQTLMMGLDMYHTVISYGSESNTVGHIAEIKERHPDAIVWLDDDDAAEKMRAAGLFAISSKEDANDLLQAAKLDAAIIWILDNANKVFTKRNL